MSDSKAASTFRVERSIRIDADPAAIFPFVNDFRRWREWSPYEDLDPSLKRTYSGQDHGTGAVYGWRGNGKAGAGRMEIIEVAEPHRITIRLNFSKPMRAENTAAFTFEPDGGATRVTWAMEGRKPIVFRIMSLFVDMDRLIGRDFEKGLAKLKAITETPSSRRP